jgi:hypothetical protein
MVSRGAASLRGVNPENWDFFGPWNGTSEESAIWAQVILRASVLIILKSGGNVEEN